jgi:hypothetical protein
MDIMDAWLLMDCRELHNSDEINGTKAALANKIGKMIRGLDNPGLPHFDFTICKKGDKTMLNGFYIFTSKKDCEAF